MILKTSKHWALLWRQRNKLDGVTEHIIHNGLQPALFKTRKEAARYRDEHFGYIRN